MGLFTTCPGLDMSLLALGGCLCSLCWYIAVQSSSLCATGPRDRTGGGDKGGGGGRSWVFRDWIDFLGIFGSLFFSRFLRTGMTTSTSSSLNSSQDSSGSDHPSSVADPLPTGDFQSQAIQKSLLFPPIWKFQTPECGLKKNAPRTRYPRLSHFFPQH